MKDKFMRNINYLRLSVTDLCNLRCIYCMPKNGIKKMKHDDIMRFEEILKTIEILVSSGITKIRITGGEPLVKKGIMDLIKNIGVLEGLKDFSITTNGVLLKKYAKELKNAGIKRINISLDTLDKDKYSYITRGGDISKVLDGINEAQTLGFDPIKINTVLIKGFNDDEIQSFAKLTYQNLNIRFIELMPMGSAVSWSFERYLSNQYILDNIPGLKKTKNMDIHSPAENFKLKDASGSIGLISPISCKFCSRCNRIRMTSDGNLISCLHCNMKLNLKTILRNGGDLRPAIRSFIYNKPYSHSFHTKEYISKNMVQIGG